MASKNLRVVKDEKKQHKTPLTRNPITYGFSIVILVLIIVAFAYTPGTAKSSTRNPYLLGIWGSKEIHVNFLPGDYTYDTYSYYLAYQKYMFELGQTAQNPNTDNNLLKDMWEQAYKDTVYRYAMLDEAEEYGITSDKTVINREIRANEYQENGEFSRNLYDQSSRVNRANIEKKYTDSAIVNELEKNLVFTSHISSREKDYLDSIAGNEKQFEIIAFPLYDYPEEEIIKYARENSDLFRKVSLSKITIISGQDEAEELHRQLSKNTSLFGDKAKASSKDNFASQGGAIGWSYSFSLENNFQSEKDFNTVINLAKDEISPVIETKYGWVIYRCDEPARDSDMTDSEDIQNIKLYISIYAGGEIEDYYLAKAAEVRDLAIQRGIGWAAASIDKDHYVSEFFPLTYGTAYIGSRSLFKQAQMKNSATNIFSAVTTNQELLEKMNGLDLSEVSEPEVAGQYVLLVSLVNERTVAKENLDSKPSNSLESMVRQYYRGDLYS